MIYTQYLFQSTVAFFENAWRMKLVHRPYVKMIYFYQRGGTCSVKIGNHFSTVAPIKCGIPQGYFYLHLTFFPNSVSYFRSSEDAVW